MKKILLDTNILHQEGLTSTRFQILQRLVKSGNVSLIIPEIVIEEYKSKRIEQASDDLNKIQSAIDRLHRKATIDKDCFEVSQFSNFLASTVNEIDQAIETWLSDNQVVVLPISNTSIDGLFKSYFAGTGAFRNKKQREDIPDAVIYDCIIKLAKTDELTVIAKDGVLIESIKNLDNIRIYKELAEVIDTPILKMKLAELNASEMKVKSIIETLSTGSCIYDISEFLTENNMVKVEGLYDDDFVEFPYDLNSIELKGHEVQVASLNDVYVSSPTYLGRGKFSYTLEVECDASLSFYCESDAYESLSYEYRKALSKSEISGQSEVFVKGDISVLFKGVAVLSGIDTSIDSSQLEVHLSYLGVERSQIVCEVNLEKLEVKDIY
jgi:rRNA-processing protein FCF1